MNAGYGRGYSVLEVLDAVDRVTNVTIERRMEGRRAGDPDALVSDNARILETLPWRPRYADLDRIISDALAWERTLAERGSARSRREGAADRLGVGHDQMQHPPRARPPPHDAPGPHGTLHRLLPAPRPEKRRLAKK